MQPTSSFGRVIKETERGALMSSTVKRGKEKREQAKLNKELGAESQVWLDGADPIAERMIASADPPHNEVDYESNKQLVLQRLEQLTGHDYGFQLKWGAISLPELEAMLEDPRISGAVPPGASPSQDSASFYPSITASGNPASDEPHENLELPSRIPPSTPSHSRSSSTIKRPVAKKARPGVESSPAPRTSGAPSNEGSQVATPANHVSIRSSQPTTSRTPSNSTRQPTSKLVISAFGSTTQGQTVAPLGYPSAPPTPIAHTNTHSEATGKVDKGKKRALRSESPPPSPSQSPSPPSPLARAPMTSYAGPSGTRSSRVGPSYTGSSNAGRMDSLPEPVDLLYNFERALPFIDRKAWEVESQRANRAPPLRRTRPSIGSSSEDGEDVEDDEGGEDGDDDEQNENHEHDGEGNGRPAKKRKRSRPPLSRTKPKLEQMSPNALRVIRRVYPFAMAIIIAGGVYEWTPDDVGPNVGTYDEIIIRVWQETTEELEVDVPYDDPYGTWIIQQLSAYRNRSKVSLLPVSHEELGLKERYSNKNESLVDQLLPDGFHTSARPNTDTRQPESHGSYPFFSNYFLHGIKKLVFSDGKLGIRFPELFNPLPIRFMAYLATMSAHVINCHAKGFYDAKKPLKLNEQSNTFRSYLEQLVYVTRDDPESSEEFRTQLYDVARIFYNKERFQPQPNPPTVRPMRTWRGIGVRGYVTKYPVKKRDHTGSANGPQPNSDDEQAMHDEEIEHGELRDHAEKGEEGGPSDAEQDLEDGLDVN